MSDPDPPVVRLSPDGAGYLLKRRTMADGTQQVLVSWSEITPGPRGALVIREDWLPLDRVSLMPGVDYSAVEHIVEDDTPQSAPTAENDASGRPSDWPAQVRPPGTPRWQASAAEFLLEALPPDYRSHEVFRHNPRVLAWTAACHVAYALAALRQNYRTAAVDLKPHLAPHVIEQVLDTHRVEGRRLTALAASIAAVGQALGAPAPRGLPGRR